MYKRQGKNPEAIPRDNEESKVDFDLLARSMPDKLVSPIFSVSNVTGEGIDKLKTFLGCLRSRVELSG